MTQMMMLIMMMMKMMRVRMMMMMMMVMMTISFSKERLAVILVCQGGFISMCNTLHIEHFYIFRQPFRLSVHDALERYTSI